MDSSFRFGGSRIELFDAKTSEDLAEQLFHRGSGLSPLYGFFTLQSISVTTESSGGPIGNRLGIRLARLGEGPKTWFDNVTHQEPTIRAVILKPPSLVMLSVGSPRSTRLRLETSKRYPHPETLRRNRATKLVAIQITLF